MRQRSGLYQGAKVSSHTSEWVFGPVSADQELRQGLVPLRARSRDLQRNSPIFRWYLTLLKSNVIGAKAPRYVPMVRRGGALGELDKPVNQYLSQRWLDWSRGPVTADGRLDLRRFLLAVIQALAVDGEVFIRRVVGYPHSPFGFALELLEPDLCDEHLNSRPGGAGGADVRLGVEVDQWRRPRAYHFWEDYPGEGRGQRQRVPIPASEVFHLFDVDRCLQTRGVPWTKTILIQLKMLDGFFEAELVASRASAQKSFGLKYDDASIYEAPEPDEVPEVTSSPGEGFLVPPGMSIEQYDPQHPNAAFGDFVRGSQQLLASGLGLFANTLGNDAKGISWSSMRSFLQIERDVWQMVQGLVCEAVLPWIHRSWLETGSLVGAIELPTRDWRQYVAGEHRPRGWVWVDPENQAKAANLQLAGGTTSPQRVLAPQGLDLEDVLEEHAEWRRMCLEYGLDPDRFQSAWLGQGSTQSAGGPQDGGAPPDDGGDDDTEDDEDA